MSVIKHNPEGLFPPYRSYSHAVEIQGNASLLFISGLNGYFSDGQTMPETFEEQGNLIWQHIGTILKSAGMSYQNVVSIRTYLSDPSYDESNVQNTWVIIDHRQPLWSVSSWTKNGNWRLR